MSRTAIFRRISPLNPRKAPSTNVRHISSATASETSKPKISLLDDPSGFPFPSNPLPPKPRTTHVTEIRGPYYSAYGPNHLQDLLECYSPYIDGFKFAGGSFSLLPRDKLESMIAMCKKHGVYTSTGGWVEHILANCRGNVGFGFTNGGKDGGVVKAVDTYLHRCKEVGFDVVELSKGFLSLPGNDWCRLVERVQHASLKPKPELGILFGAGGDTPGIASQGGSPAGLLRLGRKFLNMGVERLMIESEGITENVPEGKWRTDVIEKVWEELEGEKGKVMFEASEPSVFKWYVKTFGNAACLFVDHSQVVQLAGLRKGIWGMNDVWGRVVSYRPDLETKETN